MAVSFTYDVTREDGTGYKSFRNQKKAEDYAVTLKRVPDEKIKITRSARGYPSFEYYV